MGDAGAVSNVLARQVKHNRAVIDADDAVGGAIEVGRNVAREQHAVLTVGDKGKQFIKQLFKQFIKRLKQFRFIKLRFIICNCSVGFGLCMAYTGLCKPFI